MQDVLDPLIDQIDPSKIVTGDIHLFTTTLYTLLFVVSIFFAYKIRKGFINAGQWEQGYLGKGFFGSVVGLSIIIINFILSHLWLYLTNGSEILIFNLKGMVAGVGYLLFLGLFPYASLIIIHVSDRVKRVAKILLWGTEVGLITGLGLSVLAVFSIIQIDFSFVLLVLILIGSIMSFMIFITTVLLIRESQNTFSKINKIRLRILVLGLVFFIVDLSSVLITFTVETADPQLFILWLFIIQPIQRFITYTATFSLFYLSFFFPLWLQKRTGALPPSFQELMKKRKSMQWNKIVQREKSEQEETT